MNAISYSLFGEDNYKDRNRFVFDKYVLGLYFNVRMNMLIYRDWQMVLFVENTVYDIHYYRNYIDALREISGMDVYIVDTAPKCEAMLWRMIPLFSDKYENVICRDLDGLTCNREASAVRKAIKDNVKFHVIHDNSAHGGMMGGLVGFNVQAFKDQFPYWNNFASMVQGERLDTHGTDQDFMNRKIYPKIKNELITVRNPQSDRSNPLWTSDLCISFIGTAGVNEMETLRFFEAFDRSEIWDKFENDFNKICYWKR